MSGDGESEAHVVLVAWLVLLSVPPSATLIFSHP